MFDLDKEVTAWSEAVYAGRCRRAASVAELSDHLYCEIDRARADGLPDEQAFAAAVAKLGSGPELAAEDAKNRSVLQTACATAARSERGLTGEHRKLLLAHAILWAALILGSSLVLSKTAAPKSLEMLFVSLLIPIWWASEQLLRRALRRPKPTVGA